MLNEEQQAHVKWLDANPDKVCGCGWYSKFECERFCQNPQSQRVEERRISELIKLERRIIATQIEEYSKKFWDIKDDEDATRRNRFVKFHLEQLVKQIRN